MHAALAGADGDVFEVGDVTVEVDRPVLVAQQARYSDFLLGPLPESAARYRDRSPLFHADKIRDALIVFQGAEDNVVPQNQSDKMIDLLRARGVPVEYHIYTGEGHGFRKPETIDHYLKSVLAFLERTVIYA